MSEVDEEAQGKPCLSKVCSGEAGCALNLLCCPLVMLFNAYDIYLRPLLLLYLFQILDGIFCAPFRLICCACCCRHTDKAFPPSPSSIGEWDGKKGRALNEIIEWERASKYFAERLTDDQKKRGVRVKLFDKGINPEDVAQGQLGNCWLIAAMACLAEHPGLLRRVFKTRRASNSGRYIMNLYDGQEGTWKNISVDESIPVRKSDRSLLFANPHGNEMWVIMLEKVQRDPVYKHAPIHLSLAIFCHCDPRNHSALLPSATTTRKQLLSQTSHHLSPTLPVSQPAPPHQLSFVQVCPPPPRPPYLQAFAKFCGSYAALAGGHTLWAFHTVTGDPVFALKRRDDGSWVRQNLKFTKDDHDKRSMAFYTTQESYDSDKTFFLLRKFCRIKTLLGAAINNAGEFKRDDGLVAGHACELPSTPFPTYPPTWLNL